MSFNVCYLLAIVTFWPTISTATNPKDKHGLKSFRDSQDRTVLETWTYSDDFEDRDLGAWASYPLWQDIAYNQNFRVNEIVPGDSNISIVQKVTPYTAVDNYAGAQKLLDMYLVPGAKVRFRYYLKTHQPPAYLKVRFAAGPYGKLDVTLEELVTNQWKWVTLDFNEFIQENPAIAGKEKIKIHALAFLAKFSNADPDMPIYFGLDDITFKGARTAPFRFSEPEMLHLPEFKPYIPRNHYYTGSTFHLSGEWTSETKEVRLDIVSYTDRNDLVFKGNLSQQNGQWSLSPIKLDFPAGLYLGKLSAYEDNNIIADTEFTIHIAPRNIGGKHPRLLFDEEQKKEIDLRFQEARLKPVYETLLKNAQDQREKIPVESLIFDLDQFPDEVWLPSWDAWGSHIYHTGEALRINARAYAFHADLVAGEYVKQVLLRLASWPNWTHPWQTKRGRFSEHRTGGWSHRVAEAYDLVYDLMSDNERAIIRKAIMKNIVEGVHRTYVYNDNITAATSNWLAMTVGGSLMCQAAIFEDGKDSRNIEPYFTGAIMKLNRYLNKVTDSKDGAWGEGFSYNNYSFSNLSYSLPSIENVFHINLSQPLVGTYNEYIWAGLIKNKRWFEYGDSGGELKSATNWAYLLSKYKEPRLSWFYHFLKESSSNHAASAGLTTDSIVASSFEKASYEDVVFNTENIPQKDPFEENPVKLFRDLGTTVFKSGWGNDDFVFVMRTGPTYNHQHLDQGSFWLADRGKIFIEERPLSNSNYYDDPIYESWFTQPVGHSTILVNGNHQSQRVGDHLNFAPGFNDHAYVSHFLDGKEAAFSSGNIGRLYWDKVSDLSRNVLYLKPNTVLMLDVAVPSAEDAEITLLYQTARLEDIHIGENRSTIAKDDATLHVLQLSPSNTIAKAVETPHYIRTLQHTKPMEREGMLTISSHTDGRPLVMANLLTTTPSGKPPEVIEKSGNGFISGIATGKKFAFSTKPGQLYKIENISTDALTFTWDDDRIFVAKALVYQDDDLKLSSNVPITFEYTLGKLTYYAEEDGILELYLAVKPTSITLNDQPIEHFSDEPTAKKIILHLPKGDGEIIFKY